MLKPILTPLVADFRGRKSPGQGGHETPVNLAIGLEGRVVCNGRFLLRRRDQNPKTVIQYSAYDLWGGMEVNLEFVPDLDQSSGYRIYQIEEAQERKQLPDLYALQFTSEQKLPAAEDTSLLKRLSQWVQGILRG